MSLKNASIWNSLCGLSPDSPLLTRDELSVRLEELIIRARKAERQRILRLNEVASRTGRAGSTLWKDIANGVMPSPIPLGARAVGWLESEINAWIEARALIARSGAAVDMKDFVSRLTSPGKGE